MTRMIERWFPCADVSTASTRGWGKGKAETTLFTWFAARPPAQAKAAVICSLLPWPDKVAEQERLRALVKDALTGRYAAWAAIREEILKANPDGALVLDPFSGRAMIPLEAARLGLPSVGTDYSPVAVLAGRLQADFPFRDWSNEPTINFADSATSATSEDEQVEMSTGQVDARLLADVRTVLTVIGNRHASALRDVYPTVDGRQPWGYLWAVTIPCQECGRRFPMVGSYVLRLPSTRGTAGNRREDPGQSFYVDGDPSTDRWQVVVHDGSPRRTPTMANAVKDGKKVKGKSATCPFSDCGHVHQIQTHQRLANEGHFEDVLLLVADHDADTRRHYRLPTPEEAEATARATKRLQTEPPFTQLLPAIPNETIPDNNGATIRPALYGARTYGDLMNDRQTLSFVTLARIINDVAHELRGMGASDDYVRALTGYAAAAMTKKLRRSTRGGFLQIPEQAVHDIYMNESTISFSHDYLEAGIGTGPATWSSMALSGLGLASTLGSLMPTLPGHPTDVINGSATALPQADKTVAAVVTDPPYDAMVYYSDASDVLYVWLKRALATSWPEMAVTADPRGIQDKSEEIIVKEHGRAEGEHRDRAHYDRLISDAFTEMRRVVRDDGVVTIVFGHGDPEVWQRFLGAISKADLVMTGSWPANTESGSHQGKANIETTLTMACRAAASNRPVGLKAQVEAEVKAEVKSRIDLWDRSGLAPTDMLMASAGPAMEVVGRYTEVRDITGKVVDPAEYLVVARRAVQEDSHIEVDHHPLDTFDARTRFALWWVQLFRKNETAKSELRWQTLAADLDLAEVRDLVTESTKGVKFIDSAVAFAVTKKAPRIVDQESAVVDVALAMAAAWAEGMEGVGAVLAKSDREDDPFLWAAVKFLSERLPESDPDAIAWTKILRNKGGVTAAARGAASAATESSWKDKQEALDFSGVETQ